MTRNSQHRSVRGLVVFVCLLAALPAQNPTPLPDAEQKIETAQAFIRTRSYDQAITAYQAAIEVYRAQEKMVPMLETQRTVAKLWGDTLGLPVKGLEYLNTIALPQIWHAPETEDECRQHCLLLIRKADFEKRIGNFDAVKGDLLIALSYLDRQLAIGHSDLAAYIFTELGNAYVRLGEYIGAEKVFERSVQYAESQESPEVIPYNDYGSLYMSMKNYPEALKIFERGMQSGAVSDVDQALLYLNKAECLAQLEHYKEAMTVNKQAATLIAAIDSTDDRFERCRYGLYENFGIIHLGLAVAGDTAQFAQAESRYRAALEFAKSARPISKREIAGFLIGLGEVLESQGNFGHAIGFYNQAMQWLIPEFKGNLQNLPELHMLSPEKLLVRVLEREASCFMAFSQPEKALRCHELIPVVGAKLIATHAYESSSLRSLDEGRARFDQGVAIAWQLYEQTGERTYAERAFALTEQARAVLLMQSIAKARRDFGLPPAVREEESQMDATIAWYEQLIATEQESEQPQEKRLAELNAELFDLKRKQQILNERLRREYPDYAGLSDELEFLSAGSVRTLLGANQSMVNYYLTNSTAYIFYFNKDGDFLPTKVTLPPQFREQVLRYFTFMSSNREDAEEKKWFLAKSSEWYDLLLRPELEKDGSGTNSLLIIPDDVLAFIPFDILLTEPAKPDARWREHHFLLNTYSTGYAYSATLWDMQQKISAEHRSKPDPEFSFAGFAPRYGRPAASGDNTRSVQIPDSLIYDIRGTQMEVQKVHALMGGQRFEGANCSERHFKEIAPNCRILLLAMHGLANDEYPELSCLLFGRPKGDSINNDVLFTNELQIMQLQADLAVLSACHTGFGKLQKGEGVYSLARAFAVAGVPSTVMSLWRLHELSAPVLMESFFKYLKAGKTKDEALRLAKLDFLGNDANYERNHPFYWAGVSVSGDLCALEHSNGWWYGLLAGIMALVLLGVWMWKRRGRGNN